MAPTLAQMRKVKWTQAFEYDDPPLFVRIFTNVLAPKLTMAHVRLKKDPNASMDIQFRSHGRKLPTLADAVRAYATEEERQRRGPEARYRPKTARRRKAAVL